jgi:membrane associated rhomboid family serine protease
VDPKREKILNLPGAVTALLAVLILVQIIVGALPESGTAWLFDEFAFIPARTTFLFAPQMVLGSLATAQPGEAEEALLGPNEASALWSLGTYSLLHANWTHLGVNGVTLAAFGAPLARRLKSFRFVSFFAVCAILGALTHLLMHPVDFTPVVGASAGISGIMAGVACFAFQPGAALGEPLIHSSRRSPDASGFHGSRRALIFIGVWLALNLMSGVFPQGGVAAGNIAWEAHMGGFLGGLLLFRIFDRAGRRAEIR